MEKFKKKNLQFSGFSKELKVAELVKSRSIRRFERLSILRSVGDGESKENVSSSSEKVEPKKTKVPSRAEMLMKWKEEKRLQKEKLIKKPVFTVSLLPKLTTLKGQSSLSFGSKSQSKSHSKNASNANSADPVKSDSGVKTKTTKYQGVTIRQPSTTKPDLNTKANTKVSSFGFHRQPLPKSQNTSAKTANTQISGSKPALPKCANVSSDKASSVRDSKPVSNTLKSIPQVSKCKPSLKLTAPTTKSRVMTSKLKPCSGSSVSTKETTFQKKNLAIKPEVKPVGKKISAEVPVHQSSEVFHCDVSQIDVIEPIKSFAPQDFLFCPPTELNCTLFNFEAPSFLNVEKNKDSERTSTPLKGSSRDSNLFDTDVEKSLSPSTKQDVRHDYSAVDASSNLSADKKSNAQVAVSNPPDSNLSDVQDSCTNKISECVKLEDLELNVTIRSKKEGTNTRASIKPALDNIKEISEPATKSRQKKAQFDINFTPRRSMRLASKARKSRSCEDLFHISRPSIMETFDMDDSAEVVVAASFHTDVTADFENLQLETPAKKDLKEKHNRVSLLYTPPSSRRTLNRKSIKGDLMTFSPSL